MKVQLFLIFFILSQIPTFGQRFFSLRDMKPKIGATASVYIPLHTVTVSGKSLPLTQRKFWNGANLEAGILIDLHSWQSNLGFYSGLIISNQSFALTNTNDAFNVHTLSIPMGLKIRLNYQDSDNFRVLLLGGIAYNYHYRYLHEVNDMQLDYTDEISSNTFLATLGIGLEIVAAKTTNTDNKQIGGDAFGFLRYHQNLSNLINTDFSPPMGGLPYADWEVALRMIDIGIVWWF